MEQETVKWPLFISGTTVFNINEFYGVYKHVANVGY